MITANQLAADAAYYYMRSLENRDWWQTACEDSWRAAFALLGALKPVEWSEWESASPHCEWCGGPPGHDGLYCPDCEAQDQVSRLQHEIDHMPGRL